jgi:hypothetical protein
VKPTPSLKGFPLLIEAPSALRSGVFTIDLFPAGPNPKSRHLSFIHEGLADPAQALLAANPDAYANVGSVAIVAV